MLNRLQQGMKRREIRRFLDDPGLIQQLAGPLDRQTNVLIAQSSDQDAEAAVNNADYAPMASALGNNLVTNEGLDSATVSASPFAQLLQQLLAILLPMLVSCIPGPKPASAAEVLKYVR